MEPKSFWRLRNILLLVFGVPLLSMCIWSAWAVHWAFNAQPGSAVDYAAKMEELVASRQAADASQPNKWEEFASVVGLARKTTGDYSDSLYDSSVPINVNIAPAGWPEGWTWPPQTSDALASNAPDVVLTHTRAIIKANDQAGVFSQMQALRDHRHFVRPIPSNEKLLTILLPELGETRNLARINVARQRLAHAAQDDETTVASFEDTLTLARAIGHQSTLIDRLVAIAIRALVCEELRTELAERPISQEHLVRLLDALDRVEHEPGLDLSLEGERLFAMDTIQWTHTDNGNGDGRFIPAVASQLGTLTGTPIASQTPFSNIASFVLPSKKQTTAVFNEFYDLAIEQAALPAAQRSIPSLDTWVESLPRTQILARLMVPAIGKAIQANDVSRLDLAGTRAMVAVEIYKARHGTPPAALSNLLPDILPSLPQDPWNPDGFVYRVDPGAKVGYVLYAKGADQTDDGGTFDPKLNMAAIKPDGRGKDYRIVVERSRRE